MSNKFESHDRVLAHINATLPDSISARRELINSLLSILPKSYPKRSALRLQIETLEEVDRVQMQLSLELNP